MAKEILINTRKGRVKSLITAVMAIPLFIGITPCYGKNCKELKEDISHQREAYQALCNVSDNLKEYVSKKSLIGGITEKHIKALRIYFNGMELCISIEKKDLERREQLYKQKCECGL